MKKNLLGSRSFLYDNEFVFLSEFHDDIVHNEQFYVLNSQRSTRISGVSISKDIEASSGDCLVQRSLKGIQTQCYDDGGLR